MLTTNPDFFDRVEKLGQRIEKWFRGFRHRKEVAKIHKGLVENPKLLLDTKEKFERAFGVAQHSRSAKQWQNLVRVYGMPTVCKQEGLTEDQVANKMIETFTQRIKQIR
jgi:hypothetical protein